MSTPIHKVFISCHEEDLEYKKSFAKMMESNVVGKSVHEDDIDDENLPVDEIRRRIRDNFIADATVTVVLIGPCTWQRKHVDWEISSSLRATKNNSRCGLLGILLPNHINHNTGIYLPKLIPPRLVDNTTGEEPYVYIYNWNDAFLTNEDGIYNVVTWIHQAFLIRDKVRPKIHRKPPFKNNRSGDCSKGWWQW